MSPASTSTRTPPTTRWRRSRPKAARRLPRWSTSADAAAIAPAVERCAQKLGGLDGLALNVGISCGLPLAKMTAEAWDRDYAVNVRSHMLFAQKALTMMAPGGAIVLTSSMASQRANGRNPAYESSKAAQIALGRAIARAGEENGVRCNVIAPGFIDSPMGRDASRRRADRALTVPFGRQGTGWEVAYAALFLISNESPTSTATRCSSMPAIWPVSCGASLRGTEWLRHCAMRRQCPTLPHLPLFRKPRYEPVQTLRALQARPDHPAEPPGDGAPDAQPRGAARHGAEPARDRVLRPARLGRTADHRSEPGFAAGPGLSGHARHLFEGTGRGLAQGHRPRA